MCTLGNSNIAITIRHCSFESALVWKHSYIASQDCVVQSRLIRLKSCLMVWSHFGEKEVIFLKRIKFPINCSPVYVDQTAKQQVRSSCVMHQLTLLSLSSLNMWLWPIWPSGVWELWVLELYKTWFFPGQQNPYIPVIINACWWRHIYRQLRARRALMLFNDVPLRTRKALIP